MNKKIGIGLAVILFISIIIVIFIQYGNLEEKVIKIGVLLPLTGDAAFYGESILQAVDFAAEQINESGGINGNKLKVIAEDSKGSPREGVTAFNKLGDAISSVTLAIAPIANKNNIVVLSPLSSAPEITNAGDYIFRNVPSDLLGGKVAAHFAIKNQNWKSLAILFVNNDFGTGLANAFIEEASILGGTILAKETYNFGSTDFRAQLTKIKYADPDAIFFVAYQEASTILIQSKELGLKSNFLGTGLVEDPKIIEIAGEAAEGVFFTQLPYTPDLPFSSTKNFVKAFKETYNIEPNILAAYGFDSMNILAFALNNSDLNSKSIKNELYKIKEYEGVTGIISFDMNGDVAQPMGVKIIKNGEFIWYNREVSIE
jgi:branched-chain amino acid transport system substrate-binding protein